MTKAGRGSLELVLAWGQADGFDMILARGVVRYDFLKLLLVGCFAF